jgi:excisionase family DNA binding protein
MANEPNPDEALLILIKGLSALPAVVERIDTLESEVASLRKTVAQSKAPKKWLTLKEAAELLSLSQKTVRGYIDRGLLRRNEASRHILIPAEDVEAFDKKVTFN